MNPQLPPLSDREIYAMSHPDAPDFESEMYQKSWYQNPMDNYKRPTTTPFEQAGLVRTKATTNLFGSMFDFIEDRK